MTPAEKLSQSKPRRIRLPTNHPAVWKCGIREERERLRLSIREVAEAVGMCTTACWQIERGSDPMLTSAVKFAEFFGMPIDELWKKSTGGTNGRD